MNRQWEDSGRTLQNGDHQLWMGRSLDAEPQAVIIWLQGEATAMMRNDFAAALRSELNRCMTLRLVFQDVTYFSNACLKEILTLQIDIGDREHKQIELLNVPLEIIKEMIEQGIDQQLPIGEADIAPPMVPLQKQSDPPIPTFPIQLDDSIPSSPKEQSFPIQESMKTTIILISSSEPFIKTSTQAQITIGRSNTSTIVIPADKKSVSRNHIKIYKEQKAWCLQDIGSTYGTIMNDKPVITGEATPINGAAFLILGKTHKYIILIEPYLTVPVDNYLKFLYDWNIVPRLRSLATNESILLADSALKLGRHYAMGTMMTSKGIGREHGEIVFEDGIYRIVDRSTNGVFINDERIVQGEPTPMRDGDTIRLGGKEYGETYIWELDSLNWNNQKLGL